MAIRTLSRTLTSGANVATPTYVTTGLTQFFDAASTSLTSSAWTDRQASNNSAFTGTPTVSTTGAASNKFVTFNGSTQYATGFTSAVGLSTFSVYMWMKTTTTVAFNSTYYLRPCLFGLDIAGAGSNDWAMTLSGGLPGAYTGMGSGDQSVQSTTQFINDGKWHELVLTCSSANGMKLFCDQTQVGSTMTITKSSNASTQPNLGRVASANDYYANFSCAVLMVYGSRELTTTDRATNRAYFIPRYF
jgi:hypothetical protein